MLTNGRIWTGDPTSPWAQTLAAEDGRVVAVGSTDAVEVTAGAQVMDLQGRLVLPGFIDDHTHFVHGGEHLGSVDLRDAASPQELAHRLRVHCAKLEPQRWIVGGSWDHEAWPGALLPTRQQIDDASQHHPVFVARLDGHMALANSLALTRAGVTRATPDPPGGRIVRDADGEPTGVVKDQAMGLVSAVIPPPTDTELDSAVRAAMGEAARVGVTSIQDISTWPHFESYQRLHAAKRLTVRVAARTPIRSWERQADLVDEQGVGDSWLKLAGLKAFMDGSLGSSTALFFEPYADEPSTAGLMVEDNQPEGALLSRLLDADRRGLQCSTHAIGDRANSVLLDYYEQVVEANGKRDRRFRIEHAQHVQRPDVQRFARLEVIASAQPCHATDDGRWAERRLGRERLASAFPFRSFLDAGVRLVFGSDWTVAPLSPILGIHAAVTRVTTDGRHPGGWVPEQKISVEEAVRAYTSEGAYAEFAEHEKGRLAPGMLCDAVVLSEDVFAVPPERITDIEVVTTIVDGEVIHDRS